MNHSVFPDFVQIVAELIRRYSISNILELGSGTSTLFWAGLLDQFKGNGKLTSLEDSEPWASLVQAELDTVTGQGVIAKVIHVPLTLRNTAGVTYYELPVTQLVELGYVDLIVVDGPSDIRLRKAVFSVMGELFSPSTILVFDDGDQNEIRQGVQEWIIRHPNWSARYYPTIKGTWVVWNSETRLSLPLP